MQHSSGRDGQETEGKRRESRLAVVALQRSGLPLRGDGAHGMALLICGSYRLPCTGA